MFSRQFIALVGVLTTAYQESVGFVVAWEQAETKDHDIGITSDLSIESQRLFITSAFKMDYGAAQLFCREQNTTMLPFQKEHWNPKMLSSIETFLDPNTEYWLYSETKRSRGPVAKLECCYKMRVDAVKTITIKLTMQCSSQFRYAICTKPWGALRTTTAPRLKTLSDKIDELENRVWNFLEGHNY